MELTAYLNEMTSKDWTIDFGWFFYMECPVCGGIVFLNKFGKSSGFEENIRDCPTISRHDFI